MQGHDLEHLKKERTLAADVAETICRLPGVLDARLHLTLADHSILADNSHKSSHGVLVLWKQAGTTLNTGQLKDLVSASVAGLDSKDVALFVFNRPHIQSSKTWVPNSRLGSMIVVSTLLAICLLAGGFLIIRGLRA